MLEWTTHTLFPSGRCSPSCRASHPHRIAQELPEQDWVPTMGGREGAVPGVLRLRGSCGARGGPTDVRDLGSCDQWPSLASGDDPSRGVEPPSSQFHSRCRGRTTRSSIQLNSSVEKPSFAYYSYVQKVKTGKKTHVLGLKTPKPLVMCKLFLFLRDPMCREPRKSSETLGGSHLCLWVPYPCT